MSGVAGMNELLDESAAQSSIFAKEFFTRLDRREPIVALQSSTTVIWNGTALVGADAVGQMLKVMPETDHEIGSLNTHPLPFGDRNALNMMVDVSGRCHMGTERGKNNFGFSAVFVVRRTDAGAPLVAHTMSYRLVHKPVDATIQT